MERPRRPPRRGGCLGRRQAREGRTRPPARPLISTPALPMPEFLGLDDAWPRHQEGYWREALDFARMGRWRLKYLGAAHTYGYVSCPSGEHKRKVGQTARNNETKAKELIKAVRTCERRGCGIDPADAAAQRARINQLLEVAQQILTQTESDLDLLERRQEADRELERADALRLQLQTAKASVEAALTEEAIAELEDQALEAAVAAQGPSGPELRADLERAARQARQAGQEAGDLRPPTDADSARTRAEALAERVRLAIIRLDDLQERSGGADG